MRNLRAIKPMRCGQSNKDLNKEGTQHIQHFNLGLNSTKGLFIERKQWIEREGGKKEKE